MQSARSRYCTAYPRILFRFKPGLAVVILLLFIPFLFMATGCSKGPQEAPPAPVVEVTTVIQKDVPVYREWIGTLDGMVNATIRAQVQGYLIKQNYREGDFVKAGQVLFEIDPRTFQAALEQAQGQLEAQQARWTTAKANLARIKPLADKNAVSKKDLDDSIGTEQAAKAAVLSAQAAVDKAKLDLGFTRITSPVDGISGLAKAQIGNLVGPGATEELTTVSTVQPIKAYIQVSEQEYIQSGRDGEKRAERLKAELILADGSVYPYKGTFGFADRQIDVKTGTITVAAIFPNPGNFLRPGQYGKIRVCDLHPQGCPAGAPACRGGGAGKIHGGRRRGRQQGGHPARADRRARRQPLGHSRGSQARRACRRRGDPEGPAGDDGDAEALCRSPGKDRNKTGGQA